MAFNKHDSIHEVKTLDGMSTLLPQSWPIGLRIAGLEPLQGFNYLSGKFPTSHMKFIINKYGNRYEETDVNQLMQPEDLTYIQTLMRQNGMQVVDPNVVLELIAAGDIEEDLNALKMYSTMIILVKVTYFLKILLQRYHVNLSKSYTVPGSIFRVMPIRPLDQQPIWQIHGMTF